MDPMSSNNDVHLPPSARRVHDALQLRGPITIAEAAEHADCKQQTAYAALAKLRKIGLVRKAGPKHWEAVPDKELPAGESNPDLNYSQRRVMAILQDLEPHRTKEIIFACGLSEGTIYKALRDLHEAGRVRHPRAAWWIHPDAPKEVIDRVARRPGRVSLAWAEKRRQVLENIAQGNNTLQTLRKAMGLTRQRVDQILKQMLENGDIERTQNAVGVWVYAQSGQEPQTTRDPSSCTRTATVLLNLLPESGWVSTRSLRDAAGSAANQFYRGFDHLREAGLIEEARRTKQRISGCVRLTERGRTNMCRDANAAHLAPEPMPLPAPEYAREIIRVIAGLGPQPALALQALCGLPDRLAGVIVQHMETLGVIQEAPSYFHKNLLRYDLTPYSAIVAETDLDAPTRRELADWHDRIAEALRHWTDTAGNQNSPVAITPACQAVLRLLLDEGPHSDQAIAEKLGSEAKQCSSPIARTTSRRSSVDTRDSTTGPSTCSGS
jgi:DNA-binding MarR family transcriptional regulator